MSASPLFPISIAAPVPRATTFTFVPVFFSNMGRIYPNNPEFSVLVVDAQIISFSADAFITAKIIINKVDIRTYFNNFIYYPHIFSLSSRIELHPDRKDLYRVFYNLQLIVVLR